MRDKRREHAHSHIGDNKETCPVCGGVWEKAITQDLDESNFRFQKKNSTNQMESRSNFQELKANSMALIKTSYTSKENTLRRVPWEFGNLTSQLDLPQEIILNAYNIFQEAQEKDLVRGRHAKLITAASLYLACRAQCPHTIREIASIIHSDPKTLSRAIRLLLSELYFPHYSSRCISEGIQRICSKLSLSPNIELLAFRIFEEIHKTGLTGGKNPKGIAAASIYVACQMNGEKITQDQVAEAAQITEVTVRNRYKEIIGMKGVQQFLEWL